MNNHSWRILVGGCSAIVVGACGGPDVTSGSDAFMSEVEIDVSDDEGLSDVEIVQMPRLSVTLGDPVTDGARFDFSGSSQAVQCLALVVLSAGLAPLHLADIAWEGEHNRYLAFELGSSLPRDLSPGSSIALDVCFTPPLSVIDDLSPSTLRITSDSKDTAGTEAPYFRLNFGVVGAATVQASPSSYAFRNAAPGRPETQRFIIYNDGSAATTISGVTLETPAAELALTGLPAANATLLAAHDPAYRDISFDLTFTPTGNVPLSNALIIGTAAGDVRVPITSGTASTNYNLEYSNPTAFNFGGSSQPETRSVVLTNIGQAPLTVKQPRLDTSGPHFAFKAWIPGTGGGADQEIASWPRGLAAGRAVRFDIAFIPSASATRATLTVPLEVPSPIDVTFDLVP